MARYNIKGVDLAKKLDISTNAMSSLKNAKTMPRTDGLGLKLLCDALNQLAEDLDKTITPGDLLEYTYNPQPTENTDKVFSIIKRRRNRQKLTSDSEVNNKDGLQHQKRTKKGAA